MSNKNKKIAHSELAICRIDERRSNQSCFAKGGGVAIRLDKATAVRFGCDGICIASVDSVFSKETLETKSLTAHFRERQGSGCASFDLTTSSSNCSLLAERVSRCEADFELSPCNPNIVLIPASQLDVRYCGKIRLFHKMGFPNSLQRHRALPIHVAVHRSTDNDVPEQGSSLDDGFLRMDETESPAESLLCYVMVDPGNQPCPSVTWRSYELFRDAEQGFYLKKQGDRASARIVMRKDFVGDEVPHGAVILNHDDEFVGLLVFLENGQLHPVFLHDCNLVTSSQDELKDGGTCKDLTADHEQINGKLNADCSFECSKSLCIVCADKMLPGSNDHEVNMNQQLPELATIDSGSTKFRQATVDTSSQANCSRHVADEEHDSRNESKEPATLSNPGSRGSEENVQHFAGNRVKNEDLSSLSGEGADNRDRLSVSRTSSTSSGKIDRESTDSDYGTETASRADEDGNNVQHPKEMSGSFDNGMTAVSGPADSIQGQFGGIAEQEGPKIDWTDNYTTESVSSEASDTEGSDGSVEDELTSCNDLLLNKVRLSPAMSPRRRSEPHVSRNPTPERCYSLQPTMQINSDSLVTRVIMLNVNILDELARYLDTPFYRDGFLSCWKQLASYFGIPEDVYQKVDPSGNSRPTEEMFEWFRCTRPQLTIREIKVALIKTRRQDLVDVINNKLEDDCVVDNLINYTAPDDDLFEEICLGLDTAKVNGWELFGKRLGVSRDDLAKFGSCCDAAQGVFTYIQTAKPDTTANELKQKLEKLNRKDVCTSLDNVPGDCKIGNLMSRHMNTMENVLAQLNKMSRNTNNWRHLAQEYGMSESQIRRLEPSCDQSPTKLILDYLTKTDPQMTLKDLLHALVSINRNDAINALKKYLNAESVDQLLKEIDEEIRRGQVAQRYRPCNRT